MQIVIFSRKYRHQISELREARFPPNVEMEVSNEIAEAARKAGALKGMDDGIGSNQGIGTGSDYKPKGKRSTARARRKAVD